MNTKKLIRVIALVLVVLLVLLLVGSVISSAETAAQAEATPRHQCELSMEYLKDEQALRVSQRFIYINRTGGELREVVFYAAGNLFRRESALIYENADLDSVFPEGYAPAGIELLSVKFGGDAADYGFQGDDETALRVSCALAPGESGTFEFEYVLLLMRCGAFQGVGDTDVRLSAFAFVPGVYDGQYREFILNKPLAFTRWMYCDSVDYVLSIALPEGWLLAAPGEVTRETRDGAILWRADAQDVRELAISFGRRWRQTEYTTDSGVTLRALSAVRGGNARLLDAAQRAVAHCEAWFGPFPVKALTLAQSDYPLSAMSATGVIWVPTQLLAAGGDALDMQVRMAVLQQIFPLAAYTEPSADAWLSDSLCEYLAYCMLEEERGHDRFLAAINRNWVSALQMTIPGGLRVTSDARLFDASTYDSVVRVRGAVVFHELRLAMGRERFLEGLAEFRRMGQDGRTLTEIDLVAAMDAVTGKSWEAFLTDWVFNVGQYVNQTIDWFE